MDQRNRNMLLAPRVPLAFKPKPVELARFLIAGTTGREDYTGSLTVSPATGQCKHSTTASWFLP